MTCTLQQELPPAMYLEQILNHSPRVALTYIHLWRVRNEDNVVRLTRSFIKEQFLISPTRVLNDIVILAREGLASIHEDKHAIYVTLTRWDEE